MTFYYEIRFNKSKMYCKQRSVTKLSANGLLIKRCEAHRDKNYIKEFTFNEITKEEYAKKATNETLLLQSYLS